jgi:hypothetical protein
VTDIVIYDLDDVVVELHIIGRSWTDDLTQVSDVHRTTRGRIEGAAFSFLVMIDGDSGNVGAVRLSPKIARDVDLGGDALHEQFRGAQIDNQHQRQLLDRLRQLIDAGAEDTRPIKTVMGEFLLAVCHMINHHYEMRLVATDYATGEYLSAGENIAPRLPAAFADAWKTQPR